MEILAVCPSKGTALLPLEPELSGLPAGPSQHRERAEPWASWGQLWLAWPQGSAFLLGFAWFGWV